MGQMSGGRGANVLRCGAPLYRRGPTRRQMTTTERRRRDAGRRRPSVRQSVGRLIFHHRPQRQRWFIGAISLRRALASSNARPGAMKNRKPLLLARATPRRPQRHNARTSEPTAMNRLARTGPPPHRLYPQRRVPASVPRTSAPSDKGCGLE